MEQYEIAKVSYRWLRRAIGATGLALPLLVWGVRSAQTLNLTPLPSISDYYHSPVQYLFVTLLAAIAVLLFTYPGYDRDDDLAGTLAGVFAAGVVLCPTRPDGAVGRAVQVLSILHFGFAALMFATLAIFCLVLFRRTPADRKPDVEALDEVSRAASLLSRRKVPVHGQKQRRNRVYCVCGWIIVGCIAGIAAYKAAQKMWPWLDHLQGVFVLETVALAAFGLAWMVKGEAILADQTPSPGLMSGGASTPGL